MMPADVYVILLLIMFLVGMMIGDDIGQSRKKEDVRHKRLGYDPDDYFSNGTPKKKEQK